MLLPYNGFFLRVAMLPFCPGIQRSFGRTGRFELAACEFWFTSVSCADGGSWVWLLPCTGWVMSARSVAMAAKFGETVERSMVVCVWICEDGVVFPPRSSWSVSVTLLVGFLWKVEKERERRWEWIYICITIAHIETLLLVCTHNIVRLNFIYTRTRSMYPKQSPLCSAYLEDYLMCSAMWRMHKGG